MQHEIVTENLSAYVEGSLEPAMTAAVENHLRDCADCFTEVRTLRQVYGWLDSPAAGVQPPAAFHDDVMRRIRVAERERQLSRKVAPFWRRGPVLAGAGLLAAVVLAVAAFSNAERTSQMTPASFVLPAPQSSLMIAVDRPHGAPLDIEVDPSRLGSTAAGLRIASIANGVIQQQSPAPGAAVHVMPSGPDVVVELTLSADATGAGPETWTVLASTGEGASPPPTTVFEALESMCRTFGVRIVAPTAVLGTHLESLPAGQTASAQLADIAGRYGLRAERSGPTWYLVRQ